MERPLEQHAKVLNPNDNVDDIKNQLEKVGDKMLEDVNVDVKAQGTILKNCSTTIGASHDAQLSAQATEKTATKTLENDTKDGCKAYKAAILVAEKTYPNDPDTLEALGFDLTSDIAHTKTLAPKVVNGSIAQGEFPNECIAKFDISAGADNYTVEITVKDPSDASGYILVTIPKMIFTTSKISFIVPDDYLGKPLWVKVTAHNHAGASPASNPFGGIRIQ